MENHRTGDEAIEFHGKMIGYQLKDFWGWGFSDLLNNTLRGAYCEYIVATALDLDLRGCRKDWTPWDLSMPYQWRNGETVRDEIHIEVKSGAYLQSWDQKKPSRIQFMISPTFAWKELSGYEEVSRRQSDVYVFGLYTVLDKEKADPLILDGWEFYILPTRILDTVCGKQKSISLNSIKRLGAIITDYQGVKTAVIKCIHV